MKSQTQSILITESQIGQRVRELGRKISEDYTNCDLVLLGVLKGGVVFLTDLMRAISIPVRCEFVQIASYGARSVSSGNVQVIHNIKGDLRSADVLVVEDIVDTGHSLNFLMNYVSTLQPASVKVCSLLDKPVRRAVPITIDYVGFEIADVFVIGYGLDYNQQYRNLPYVAVFNDSESSGQTAHCQPSL
jgi:hypoxanthine phosphoribosyltransferase